MIMAKPNEKEPEKVLIEPVEEEAVQTLKMSSDIERWQPKTELGRKVKSRELSNIDQVLDYGKPILEPEIVDMLLPDMETDLLMIGQSKGKFGGGSRRVFRQTQKKTKEGNKPKFSTFSVIGNKDGFVGLGFGKAKETVPAREKALRKSKLNIMRISRGCGSWQCNCKTPHSIPYTVTGKCSSVIIELRPAPKGTGLKAEKEVAKILRLAGIKDVWSRSRGQTRNKLNVIEAVRKALVKLSTTKIQERHVENLAIRQGALPKDPVVKDAELKA
jgi:small subunit ribosomal protein S5